MTLYCYIIYIKREKEIIMEHHKITSKSDIITLQEIYEDDAIFEVLDTGEEVTLPELLFGYDYQEITIQHI